MSRRKPRGLRQEEIELWQRVTETTAPLHPEKPGSPEIPKKTPPKPRKAAPSRLPLFTIGGSPKPAEPDNGLAPTLAEHLARQPIRMDRKRFGKMKKGRLTPEARLDLHGMTVAQAHPVLMRFILGAVDDGRRLVLVITGKGKSKPDPGPIPERHGVLRHQVPHWLNTAPLKPYVLQISEAHMKHGGEGAYYVYLRRSR